MRRSAAVFALLGLACGPRLPGVEDGAGDDEAGDVGTGDTGGSSSEGSETVGTETVGTETDSAETVGTETESAETGTTDTDSTGSTDTGDPGCPTEIWGTLEIDDATDLEMLACLERAEWVYVEGSFADLSALSTLREVESIHLQHMPNLVDLSGLDSLETVGDLWLYALPNLVDLGGLPDSIDLYRLRLRPGNDSLESIAMPPNGARSLRFHDWDRPNLELLLTASPDPTIIEIWGAESLTDLDDVAACCAEQQADLRLAVRDTPLLTSLQGLEAFTELHELIMYRNVTVDSLAGLQNLQTIDRLRIDGECEMTPEPGTLADLHGLEQLANVGILDVAYQDALVSLDGLPTELVVDHAEFIGNTALAQSLVDAWLAAATPESAHACDNLDGPGCEFPCPQ